jgi:zinc transporter ZupT
VLSAMVIGAVAGVYWTPPRSLLTSALAFASGALMTALALGRFQESFECGAWLSAIGLLSGAAAFVVADELLDLYIGGIPPVGDSSAFQLVVLSPHHKRKPDRSTEHFSCAAERGQNGES